MIIYGASVSPFVRKAVAFANEKGIECEHKMMPPGNDDPDFVKASPFGKIPAMSDGDYVLSDSTAIIQYLDAKKPDPVLIPTDAAARGKTIWFDKFADTILIANAMGPIFFNRVAAKFFGQEGDMAAADRAEAEALPPLLDYLEAQLQDSEWLVGDSFTFADISVASPFKNLEYAQAKIDWATYPKLRAHLDRVLGRESFAALLAADAAMVG